MTQVSSMVYPSVFNILELTLHVGFSCMIVIQRVIKKRMESPIQVVLSS